jgi:tetratricopeptide (TPR) repeat protein
MKSVFKSTKVIVSAVVLILILASIITGAVVRSNATVRNVKQKLELGEKYLSELNYEEAIIAFKEVIEIEPRNVDAYLGVATAYVALEEPEEAVEWLEQGIAAIEEEGEVIDGCDQLYIKTSEVHKELGNVNKAVDVLERGYRFTLLELFLELIEKLIGNVPDNDYIISGNSYQNTLKNEVNNNLKSDEDSSSKSEEIDMEDNSAVNFEDTSDVSIGTSSMTKYAVEITNINPLEGELHLFQFDNGKPGNEIKNGDLLENGTRVIVEAKTAEGKRFYSLTNGETDLTDMIIYGAYGSGAFDIDPTKPLTLIIEDVPSELPNIKTTDIFVDQQLSTQVNKIKSDSILYAGYAGSEGDNKWGYPIWEYSDYEDMRYSKEIYFWRGHTKCCLENADENLDGKYIRLTVKGLDLYATGVAYSPVYKIGGLEEFRQDTTPTPNTDVTPTPKATIIPILEPTITPAPTPTVETSLEPVVASENDFEYTINSTNAVIEKYIGKDGNVIIPDTLGGALVTSINSKAFYECISLIELTIPKSIDSCGSYSFAECPKLKKITFEDGMTVIPGDALFGCKSVEEVIIPKSVIKIGASAFASCTNLKKITLHEGIIEIDNCAFSNCVSLTSVVIPSTMKNIGGYTFDGCSALIKVDFLGDMPKIGYNAFPKALNIS